MVGVVKSLAILLVLAAAGMWWYAAFQNDSRDRLHRRHKNATDPVRITAARTSRERPPMASLPLDEEVSKRVGLGRINGRLLGDIDDIDAAEVHVMRCGHPQGETLRVEAVVKPTVRDAAFEATVEPGVYSLRIEVRRKGRTLYAATEPFPVDAGEAVARDVLLNGDTVITGSVKWGDGSPVAELQMLAIPMMDFRFSCSVITDDDGLFQIEGLVDGMSIDHDIHVTCPRRPPMTELRLLGEGPETRTWSRPFDFVLVRLEMVECAVILMYEGPTATEEALAARWLLDTDERPQSELQDCVLRQGANQLVRMQWNSDAPPTRPTVQLESEFGYARMRLRRVASDRLLATLDRWHPLVNTVTLTVPERMLAPDRQGVFLNRHEFNGGRYRQALLTGNTARFENVVPGTYWVRSLGRIAWEDPYGRLIVRPDGSHSPVADWRR